MQLISENDVKAILISYITIKILSDTVGGSRVHQLREEQQLLRGEVTQLEL